MDLEGKKDWKIGKKIEWRFEEIIDIEGEEKRRVEEMVDENREGIKDKGERKSEKGEWGNRVEEDEMREVIGWKIEKNGIERGIGKKNKVVIGDS